MQDFRIRASAAGKVATPAKSGKGLSKTCTGYLEEWLLSQIYGREKEIQSKYTRKGLWGEASAIKLYSEWNCLGLVLKNEEEKKNDFFSGTCDIVLKDSIDDIKCSWDNFTFPLLKDFLPSEDYYYQGQVYMDLWDKDLFRVVYMLIDTPDLIIEREAKSFCVSNGIEDLDMDIYESFRKKMTYGELDKSLRCKIFEVKRDPDIIKELKDMHPRCVEYINELKKIIPNETTLHATAC